VKAPIQLLGLAASDREISVVLAYIAQKNMALPVQMSRWSSKQSSLFLIGRLEEVKHEIHYCGGIGSHAIAGQEQ
jgi:hypothetical protein